MKECSTVSFSSSANLGPGFDTLAIAHTAFSDRITVYPLDHGSEKRIAVDCEGIAGDPLANTAGRAAGALLDETGIRDAIKIVIHKGVPYGLGLGSSGSSAAGAVKAINELFSLDLPLNDLVRFAMEGERASSGSPHADNVSASLFGEIAFVQSTSPVKVRKFSMDERIKILLLIPKIHIAEKTRKAREMVPHSVTLEDHIQNSRRLSGLIMGLQNGDRDLIAESMHDDIVEKARLPMFPFYPEVKEMSLKNGAISVSVSGAGPSILEFTDSRTDIRSIISKAESIFARTGVPFTYCKCDIAGGAFVE
ncbi:MAG: homoserine kinase [Thermoplasmataceae archaeon]